MGFSLFGDNEAPDPPNLKKYAASQEKIAELWAGITREQLDWAKTQDAENRELLERVLGVQLPQLEAAFQNAQKDRARYEATFQPVEDALIKEFQSYDTPQRREQEAAERMADVRASFEAQRRNALRELEDYGIDPSQTRFQALDLGYRAQEAAATAFAANQGRETVEQTGRALRGEAINIGRGYPSQVAQSQGVVNQTAGGAVGNAATTVGSSVNAMNPAFQAGGMQMQGWRDAVNTRNAGYQNQLAGYNAQAGADAGLWGGIGTIVGGALGGPLGGALGKWAFGAEGGEVPGDLSAIPQPGDKYPTVLAEGEFVIPADVVRRKGTEFFEKLLDKFKDGGEYEAQRREKGKEEEAKRMAEQREILERTAMPNNGFADYQRYPQTGFPPAMAIPTR